MDDIPSRSQSSLPSRPYARTRLVPLVISSVRCVFSQTNGVAQLLFSSRSARPISCPALSSNATRHDFSSLSFTTYRRFLWSTGEAAVPQPFLILKLPHFFDHSSLPSMSKQNRPRLPKEAYTRSPSVTGVSEA